jgi:hypothetical protein
MQLNVLSFHFSKLFYIFILLFLYLTYNSKAMLEEEANWQYSVSTADGIREGKRTKRNR